MVCNQRIHRRGRAVQVHQGSIIGGRPVLRVVIWLQCVLRASLGPRRCAMSETEQPVPRESLWVSAIHWCVIGLCTLGPWILHFGVAWWAALAAIPCAFLLYDRLFVPRGSICMGIPFLIPLASALGLSAFEILLLAKWILTAVAGS